MINSEAEEIVPRQTLAEAIARCPDIEARPDLILRLVDLLFLLVPPKDEPPT